MTDNTEGLLFLIEYFSGIENGDFYEEPVQGEYPDWQLKTKSEKYLVQSEIIEKASTHLHYVQINLFGMTQILVGLPFLLDLDRHQRLFGEGTYFNSIQTYKILIEKLFISNKKRPVQTQTVSGLIHSYINGNFQLLRQ